MNTLKQVMACLIDAQHQLSQFHQDQVYSNTQRNFINEQTMLIDEFQQRITQLAKKYEYIT